MSQSFPSNDFVSVADIEVDAVQPASSGFVLVGRGRDRADYRLEVRLEMPVDLRTRAVVSEILSQSGLRLWRRAQRPLGRDASRKRGHEVDRPADA